MATTITHGPERRSAEEREKMDDLTNDELAAVCALLSHEMHREGSYLDSTWREVLTGALRKLDAALDAVRDATDEPEG